MARALYIDDHTGQFRARLWERDRLVEVVQEGGVLFAGDASHQCSSPPTAPQEQAQGHRRRLQLGSVYPIQRCPGGRAAGVGAMSPLQDSQRSAVQTHWG